MTTNPPPSPQDWLDVSEKLRSAVAESNSAEKGRLVGEALEKLGDTPKKDTDEGRIAYTLREIKGYLDTPDENVTPGDLDEDIRSVLTTIEKIHAAQPNG